MTASRIAHFFEAATDVDELYSLYCQMVRRNHKIILGTRADSIPEEAMKPMFRTVSRQHFESRVNRLRSDPHRFQIFLENLYRA